MSHMLLIVKPFLVWNPALVIISILSRSVPILTTKIDVRSPVLLGNSKRVEDTINCNARLTTTIGILLVCYRFYAFRTLMPLLYI